MNGAEEEITELRGQELYDEKARQYDERLARKQTHDHGWGLDEMVQAGLAVGATVVHKETGEVYQVIGHRRQGSRGWSVTVFEPDNGEEHNFVPFAVKPVEDE